MIAALGFTANLGPIRDGGLEVTGNRYLAVDTTMSTSVAGVYAAGDIADYRGKVRLISVGFGEAATAVNNAAVLLSPESSFSRPLIRCPARSGAYRAIGATCHT